MIRNSWRWLYARQKLSQELLIEPSPEQESEDDTNSKVEDPEELNLPDDIQLSFSEEVEKHVAKYNKENVEWRVVSYLDIEKAGVTLKQMLNSFKDTRLLRKELYGLKNRTGMLRFYKSKETNIRSCLS